MNKSKVDIERVFQSVRLGKFEEYSKLIENFEIDSTNEMGQNLLFEAVVNDRIRICEDLISREINLNWQDKRGQTVLHYAALHSKVRIAELIIANGGNVNISDDYGNNALWTAVFNARGKYSIVELYCRAGGDVNHKNNSARSPVDFATQINDQLLLKILK